MRVQTTMNASADDIECECRRQYFLKELNGCFPGGILSNQPDLNQRNPPKVFFDRQYFYIATSTERNPSHVGKL